MADLDIGYLDLWLMHWPMGYEEGGDIFPRDDNGIMKTSDVDFIETWKAMEKVGCRRFDSGTAIDSRFPCKRSVSFNGPNFRAGV